MTPSEVYAMTLGRTTSHLATGLILVNLAEFPVLHRHMDVPPPVLVWLPESTGPQNYYQGFYFSIFLSNIDYFEILNFLIQMMFVRFMEPGFLMPLPEHGSLELFRPY
jgi:hypothetical protein